MANAEHQAHYHALQWYLDHGVDEALGDDPVERTKMPERPKAAEEVQAVPASAPVNMNTPSQADLRGAAESKKQALELVQGVNTLDELKVVIEKFDGLAIKKTATNMVFADGNPKANVMLVGEAPGADEDRQGKPFVGASGQLLDVILSHIGLDRGAEVPEESIYISNIVNWRPPGNRTPTQAEMDISSVFIQKHIALIQPKILILCGGIAGKTLLKSNDSISKLRGQWHDYDCGGQMIPTIATYHPAYLLRTPAQKGKVWQDMIYCKQRLKALKAEA